MNEKKVISVDKYKQETNIPGPAKQYLTIKTNDEWFYEFARLRKEEPYEFQKKRRPNGMVVPDKIADIVPQKVAEWFEKTPGVELANAHTVEIRA